MDILCFACSYCIASAWVVASLHSTFEYEEFKVSRSPTDVYFIPLFVNDYPFCSKPIQVAHSNLYYAHGYDFALNSLKAHDPRALVL